MPDWRDAAAYAPLLRADRSLFAWEWLRRDRGYRTAAEQAHSTINHNPVGTREGPERWGLHAFELPSVSAPQARPMWRADIYPYVLSVEAAAARGGEVFHLECFGAISGLVTAADGREHLLFSDGFRSIRLDVMSGTLTGGPAELRYRLAGLASAELSVLTLQRFLALWRNSRFCNSLHPGEASARRWLLMLRAHDALAKGADQREIASVLLSQEAGEPCWRTRSPSLRSQVQRLVRAARRMASGRYLELLQ